MVSTTIDITQHKGEVLQLRLRPEEGQHMGATLVLVALPAADVMIDIAGIFVGAVEDESMQAGLQTDAGERLPHDFRLYP